MDYWKILRNSLGSQQLIMTGAAGAILKDNKILLIRNNPSGKWCIPGGIQELNESIQDTIVRELKEELGLVFEVEILISIYSSPKWILELSNGDITQQVTFFFKMKGDISEDSIIPQRSEVHEFAFFNLDEIPENTMPCCKEKINDLRNFDNRVFLK
jgi:ADP-ribose pyrophosphatase YjhB (NUDIX family)